MGEESISSFLKALTSAVPKKSKEILDEIHACQSLSSSAPTDEAVFLKMGLSVLQKVPAKNVPNVLIALEKVFSLSSFESSDSRLALCELVEGIAAVLNTHGSEEEFALPVMKSLQSAATIAPVHGSALTTIFRVLFAQHRDGKITSVQVSAEKGLIAIVHHLLSKVDECFTDLLGLGVSMCKILSVQSEEVKSAKPKKLALELLHLLLTAPGSEKLRLLPPWISFVNDTLPLSLIVCSLSPRVHAIALQVFSAVVVDYHPISAQGIFLDQVVLAAVEGSNLWFSHRQAILENFANRLAGENLLDIFISFDCQVDKGNVVERLVHALSRAAHEGGPTGETLSTQQVGDIRKLCLEGLVGILRGVDLASCKPSEDVSDTEDSEISSDAAKNNFPPRLRRSSSAESVADARARKSIFLEAVGIFNQKPKKGLDLLISGGFVDGSPNGTAAFFIAESGIGASSGLSKTSVGEILGDPSNKELLCALVELFDFKGLNLVEAMRIFLSVFRLPGEGQKIDRIIERFAEKYFLDNPGVFVTADCAYLLSFSLIMLNTDLHSTKVKTKMTVEQFIKNNRGINGEGKDVDKEVLEYLYREIKNNEIILKDGNIDRIEKSKDLINRLGSRPLTPSIVNSTENFEKPPSLPILQEIVSLSANAAAQPFLGIAVWPTLAVCSVLLEGGENEDISLLAISGLRACVRIASRLEMGTERDAIIACLAKFANLNSARTSSLKPKSIECLKTLLELAGGAEGGRLDTGWYWILQSISVVERLCFSGNSPITVSTSKKALVAMKRILNVGGSPSEIQKSILNPLPLTPIEQQNGFAISDVIDLEIVDSIFVRSARFPDDGVVNLVKQLCRVSEEELTGAEGARIFLLQKLVEVADFNMTRVRAVWRGLWKVISHHFLVAVQNKDVNVCMFAVDSLRQLAKKFFRKSELSSYHFQEEFLKPLVLVMNGSLTQVKELIVSVACQFLNTMEIRQNLKSGWISIFQIFQAAAKDPSLAETAFNSIDNLAKSDFALCLDNHEEYLKTVFALARGHSASEALSLITATIFKLSALQVDFRKVWLPILKGLGSLVTDERREVRVSALGIFFDTVRERLIDKYPGEVGLVFQDAIGPLFDDLLDDLATRNFQVSSGDESLPSSSVSMLGHLLRVFDAHFCEVIKRLEQLVNIIGKVVVHPIEGVARAGVGALKQIVLIIIARNSGDCGNNYWQLISGKVGDLLHATLPGDLLSPETMKLLENDFECPFDFESVRTKCVIQLLLIEIVDVLPLPLDINIIHLLNGLERSLEFARRFNDQTELRRRLKTAGFEQSSKNLPGLFKQERDAYMALLSVLAGRVWREVDVCISEKYRQVCEGLVRDLLRKEESLELQLEKNEENSMILSEIERDLSGITPIVSEMLIPALLEIPKNKLHAGGTVLGWLFPLISDLVLSDSLSVRKGARQLLLRNIAPLLQN